MRSNQTFDREYYWIAEANVDDWLKYHCKAKEFVFTFKDSWRQAYVGDFFAKLKGDEPREEIVKSFARLISSNNIIG